jgi:hypothetical protein
MTAKKARAITLQWCILKSDLDGEPKVEAGTTLDETLYKLVFYEATQRLNITEKTQRRRRSALEKRHRSPSRPGFWTVAREDVEDSDPPLPPIDSRAR